MDSVARPNSWLWALLPILVGGALVTMISLRFSDPWAESDTVTTTRSIRGVLSQQTIEPRGLAYSNGFNYPVLAAFVADVTGLQSRLVQTTLLAWLLPVTALMAFVTFRAITRSGRAGATCALLLLIQSDFLFVTQRGGHERITWMLVLMVILALVKSLRQRTVVAAIPFILIVYAGGFAIICTNVFFASSFVATIAISFVVGFIFKRWFLRERDTRRIIPKFWYVFVTLGILTYVFMAIIYPTAQSNFQALEGAINRVALLYFGAEVTPSTEEPEDPETASPDQPTGAEPPVVTAVSPYSSISNVWISQKVFFVLTGFTWILLVYAGVSWFFVALRFFRRGISVDDTPFFLSWTFAAAAAIQIAASVAADFAGVFGANLQLRLFPPFVLFAIPLAVTTLRLPTQSRRGRPRVPRWFLPLGGIVGISAVAAAFPAYLIFAAPLALVALHLYGRARLAGRGRTIATAVGIVAFAGFAVAACLKATNDPLVSNRWLFYTQAEARAIQWGNRQLNEQRIWADFDERLALANVLVTDDSAFASGLGASWLRGVSALSTTPYLLVSDVTIDRTKRTHNPAPDVHTNDIIYDNGNVQIAHRVPRTPYQP